MTTSTRGSWRGRAAAGLTLSVAAVLVLASPTFAATRTVGSLSGSATGISSTLDVLSVPITVSPTPTVTRPATGGTESGSTISIGGPTSPLQAATLAVNTSGSGVGTGTGSSASSATVQSVRLALLSATAIDSSCTASLSATTGTTTIAGLSLPGLPSFTLPSSIPVNFSVSVPGVGTLYLNKQTVSGTSIDVRAIELDLSAPLGSGSLIVSESSCDAETATVVPYGTIGGLGLAGLLGVGFIGRQTWVVRRRRSAVTS